MIFNYNCLKHADFLIKESYSYKIFISYHFQSDPSYRYKSAYLSDLVRSNEVHKTQNRLQNHKRITAA